MSVDLIGPDGKEYAFDGDETALANAKAKGFRVASEIGAVESALDAAKAAGLGLLQGVTGGAYGAGVGASQGDEETPESAQARWGHAGELVRAAEEHPGAAIAGEIAGMVASPLNAAGNAVTKGIGATTRLGRIGANMAGGATSGLLFGAGKTLSDAALGDVELTAQKLAAGVGLGGLLGLAGGGVGGLVEEGARAMLPTLRTLAGRAAGALDEIANDAAISSTRAQQSVINRLGDDKVRRAAQALRDRGHLQGTPDAIAESLAKDRDGLGKLLGKFLDDADAAGSKADHMRLLNRLDDFEAKLNPLERDAISADLRAARRGVAELGEQGSGFRALDDLKQTIQAKAKFSKGPTPLDDTTLGLKRQLAGVFRDELDQQLMSALGAEAGKVFTDSKALYGALRDAERLAGSGAGRAGGIGLMDIGAAIAGSNVHPMGIAAALGSKMLRERGPAVIARIADRLAKEPALSAMAKSFAATLPTTAPQLGKYGAVLMQEARHSPERALAAHVAMTRVDPEYAATAQLAGLTPEQPDEHAATLGRAQALADAKAAAAAHDRAIGEALDAVVKGKAPAATSVLKSQDFGAKRMRQSSQEAHRRRVDEVRQLASDPQALLDRVSKNLLDLGQVAPSVSASMTATADRAVKYLAQAAEVPPKPGPLAREWTPTAAERHTFALKLEAVQQPMSILGHAARGTLTRQQVDAVRAVYPQFAMDLEQKALERLVSGEAMPYRARLMLSVLTGVDPDGTLSARSIAMNQQAIANAQGKPSERGPAAQGEPKMGQAERMALPGEKRQLGASETA